MQFQALCPLINKRMSYLSVQVAPFLHLFPTQSSVLTSHSLPSQPSVQPHLVLQGATDSSIAQHLPSLPCAGHRAGPTIPTGAVIAHICQVLGTGIESSKQCYAVPDRCPHGRERSTHTQTGAECWTPDSGVRCTALHVYRAGHSKGHTWPG